MYISERAKKAMNFSTMTRSVIPFSKLYLSFLS